MLGVASCHIGLEENKQAIARIEAQEPLLRQAAKWVFAQTAGKDPARFLSLPVGVWEVSLAFMADLFQQAKQAGAIEAQRDYTPADWFEEYRATITPFSRRLPYAYKASYIAGLQRELLEAVATVEEVNRLCGVELLAREVQAVGECSREVMGQLRQVVDNGARGGDHLVWAFAPRHSEPLSG